MKKLPLLEFVKTLSPSTSLSNVLIIGCQHILETTHTMFRSLYELGLDPKNIFLLGKCYSSNKSVWQRMKTEGIHISPKSFAFDHNQAFDDLFLQTTQEFFKECLEKVDIEQFKKIILIDDGGQLLSLAKTHLSCFENVVGIEQTTSGYEKIKNSTHDFSIINVARSRAKLVYESPLIAEIVIEKAINKIRHLQCQPRKILIIGNGAIGSAIHNGLKDAYEVSVYDKRSGQEVNFLDMLSDADAVIGCTGKMGLSRELHPYLKPGCVLLSASSSDREFDAVYFRRQGSAPLSCHHDIHSCGITLLNCGFPVNFDGGQHSVAPHKIQLTRALLVAAILQAVETQEVSGLVELCPEMQREIISKHLEIHQVDELQRAALEVVG